MAGSIAGGLPQAHNAATERTAQQASDQARQATSEKKAESAGGVGETEQDEQASDRDADGRCLWEGAGDEKHPADGDGSLPKQDNRQSKDPTGTGGGNLDLSG
ncbi:MAG: hypothetical protein CMJ64_05215 [Planctomycetaceae bacterium]|nr:hypothetical protein [Planctomycetaceae bacterium]